MTKLAYCPKTIMVTCGLTCLLIVTFDNKCDNNYYIYFEDYFSRLYEWL